MLRGDWWRDWRWLAAAGAGSLLVVLLGIWVVVRDKDGKEVARVPVPEGGNVTVETVAETDEARLPGLPQSKEPARAPVATKPLPQWNLPQGSPPPAIAPFDAWYIEQLPSEVPRHRVRSTKAFWLGRCEVTRGQFRQFVEDRDYQTEAERDGSGGFGNIDGQWKHDRRFVWNGDFGDLGFERTDDHPVANVSWNDATAFCEWLSEKEGETYHLPSQAQWEYTCRAGTTTRWYGTDDEAVLQRQAWCNANSGSTTHLVGQKLPNAWGLFDMHGNVWEWCTDYYWDEQYSTNSPLNDPTGPDEGSKRVNRGGGWAIHAVFCRAACRSGIAPSDRGGGLGFRLARTVSSPP